MTAIVYFVRVDPESVPGYSKCPNCDTQYLPEDQNKHAAYEAYEDSWMRWHDLMDRHYRE